MKQPILPKGVYHHFKGAKYRVIDTVRHSETEEWLVLYTPLDKPDSLWVRPLDMFNETVELAGEKVERFKHAPDHDVSTDEKKS